MVKGFLLDGVNMDGDGMAVNEASQLAANVLPRPSPAGPARKDDALPSAQKALYHLVGMRIDG